MKCRICNRELTSGDTEGTCWLCKQTNSTNINCGGVIVITDAIVMSKKAILDLLWDAYFMASPTVTPVDAVKRDFERWKRKNLPEKLLEP